MSMIDHQTKLILLFSLGTSLEIKGMLYGLSGKNAEKWGSHLAAVVVAVWFLVEFF